MKKLFVAAGLILSFICSNAQTRITGNVNDAGTGEPLIGAAILKVGTTEGVITGLDGDFEITIGQDEAIVSVSYIGYVDKQVTLHKDESHVIIALEPDTRMLEDAVVTGRKNLESLQALQNERMTSSFAIENIGAKEIGIKGISDAQESVTKLTGISVTNAGQLIVRGLGDRYSTTTLNGLPIASPNPDNNPGYQWLSGIRT